MTWSDPGDGSATAELRLKGVLRTVLVHRVVSLRAGAKCDIRSVYVGHLGRSVANRIVSILRLGEFVLYVSRLQCRRSLAEVVCEKLTKLGRYQQHCVFG